MTHSHVIRLGEPWRCVLRDGSVRYERWFHCPTGLTNETVWLVLEDAPAGACVMLNGRSLNAAVCRGGFVEFEITNLLAPRNSIQINVATEAIASASGVPGRVALDIRSSVGKH